MFEWPRIVIKSGEVIVEQGAIRAATIGKTLHVNPLYDEGIVPQSKEWFEKFYSIRFRNYPVDSSYMHKPELIEMWQEGKEEWATGGRHFGNANAENGNNGNANGNS